MKRLKNWDEAQPLSMDRVIEGEERNQVADEQKLVIFKGRDLRSGRDLEQGFRCVGISLHIVQRRLDFRAIFGCFISTCHLRNFDMDGPTSGCIHGLRIFENHPSVATFAEPPQVIS